MGQGSTSRISVVPTGDGVKPSYWAVPIALFSIPLGLAGLGGAWAAAAQQYSVMTLPTEVAYAASAIVWAVFTAMYVLEAVWHNTDRFHVDLRHPLLGPLTAYIPVIVVLLAAHYATYWQDVARWVVYVAVVALSVNAAALVAHWLGSPLEHDALHPGYFLPVVAGPFIASIGLARVQNEFAATAVFGVGLYFWLLLGAVITGRLLFGSPLPLPFKPVLSILLSPPLTASLAWFVITDGAIDTLQAVIGGVTLFTLLIQLFFLPDYLRLPFSSQHWVFTFPLAVLGNVAIRWTVAGNELWRFVGWSTLVVTSTAILSIIACTLRDVVRRLVRRKATATA